MKRIEFIAPVEAMRGNLSGTQKGLEYPTNNNAAYESPVGSRNYARNYQPIFVGVKRASDGLKYFVVKTKTAIGMTAASKKQMAVLGGAGAIMAALLRDKSSQAYQKVLECFERYQSRGGEIKTFRKYVTNQLVSNLKGKQPAAFIGADLAGTMVYINNPWHSTGYGPSGIDVVIEQGSLAKFWDQLADNPIIFTVDGGMGVAHRGDNFGAIISGKYNVLGLSSASEEGGVTVVKMGSSYVNLLDSEDIPITVTTSDPVDQDDYILTSNYNPAE